MRYNWKRYSDGTWRLEDEYFVGIVYRSGKHFEFSVSGKRSGIVPFSSSDRSEQGALSRAEQYIFRQKLALEFGPKKPHEDEAASP